MAIGDSIGNAFANLNERERRLVGLLGVVFAMIVVVLPLYLMTAAISDIESENREIASVLRDISRARGTLESRRSERERAMKRYDVQAPALRQFVAAKGEAAGLSIRETTPQPEKVFGQFTRRHLRVILPGVGLRPVVEMMASIDNSPYPVAIKRVQIEHYRTGDSYNVQLDVVAYDRAGGAEGDGPSKTPGRRPTKGSGPPTPG